MASGRQISGAPPAEDVEAYGKWLAREVRSRAAICDANAWIAMLRRNTAWKPGGLALDAAAARLASKRVLLIPGAADALLPPEHYHDPLAAALVRQGADLRIKVLSPDHGHLAGLAHIGEAATAIRDCLETPI
jgi:homoserine acetyltransferase